MQDSIKVLVVDDALFMRKAITEILDSDDQLQVVGSARDGLDGLEKIKDLAPDVITLDIDMPRMDGLSTVRHIMIESPVPVVILSSMFSDGAITFDALRLGVVDFVPKPSGAVSEDIDKSRHQIIDRVKMASSLNFENIRRVRMDLGDPGENLTVQYGFHPLEYLVTLGTSLSGPNTVIRLLSNLKPTLPAAIVVVQEIAPQILPAFVKKFNEHVPWNIEMAEDGKLIEQGACYISSNQHTLRIENSDDGQPRLSLSEKVADPLNQLFSSAAEAFEKNTVGVMLTGIGDDGADGFARIQQAKGATIAQATDCCVYPNLTHNAIEKGTVNTIVDEKRLPEAIASLMATT